MPNEQAIRIVINQKRHALKVLPAFDDIAETRIKGRPGVLVALKSTGLVTRYKARRILKGTPTRFVVLGASHSIASGAIASASVFSRLARFVRGVFD